MIQQILYIVVGIDIVIFIGVLLGIVIGQRSVWRLLRKNDVTIGEWKYTATKTENVKRYWD